LIRVEVCAICRNDLHVIEGELPVHKTSLIPGYAEYPVAPEAFVYPIPPGIPSHQAAPLLCAGIIGYRSLLRSGLQKGKKLGLYGFGASAHVVIQIAKYWGCEVYVATRGVLDYERELFYERSVRSVTANTREDGKELLRLAQEIPIQTHTERFP
jgi:propanol-preferring alcohol dehydrogenase